MTSHDHNRDEDERFEMLFSSANHDALATRCGVSRTFAYTLHGSVLEPMSTSRKTGRASAEK